MVSLDNPNGHLMSVMYALLDADGNHVNSAGQQGRGTPLDVTVLNVWETAINGYVLVRNLDLANPSDYTLHVEYTGFDCSACDDADVCPGYDDAIDTDGCLHRATDAKDVLCVRIP